MRSGSLVTHITLGEGRRGDNHDLREVFATGFASSYVAVRDVDFLDVSGSSQ